MMAELSLEEQEKWANINLRLSEAREKDVLSDIRKREMALKEKDAKRDSLQTLKSLLCSVTIDESAPEIGEQKFKMAFDESEQEAIKAKIFDIMHSL